MDYIRGSAETQYMKMQKKIRPEWVGDAQVPTMLSITADQIHQLLITRVHLECQAKHC